MKAHDLNNDINAIVDDAAKKLSEAIPDGEKDLYKKIVALSKDLKTDRNGNFVKSVENLQTIDKIIAQVDNIVRKGSYAQAVSDYAANLYAIQDLQKDYFTTIKQSLGTDAFLKQLQRSTISDTIEELAGDKLVGSIKDSVRKILRANVSTGASYADHLDSIRSAIITDPSSEGVIKRHAKTLVNDTLNNYSRRYENAIAGNIGLQWGMYVGGVIKNSRVFCKACCERVYFHVSEIPYLLEGDFPEFHAMHGKLNPDTGLPEGMYDYENEANFTTLLGGYGCRHRWVWVSDKIVPEVYKAAITSRV